MKRLLISVCAALLLSGAVAAQGLTIWTTFADQTLDWLQDETASFSAAFGIPVDLVRLDLSELRQQVLLSAPQGQAGDLFVGIPHDQIGEMAVGGVLADLSPYATAGYLSDLSDQARLAYTFSGKLFGLPMFVEGPALITNTSLMPSLPADYEEFIRVAQDLTTDDSAGFMLDFGNFYFSYAWLHTFGGSVFGRDAAGNLDPRDVGLASEGALAGARALQDLRFTYGLIPAGANYDVANGLFIDGALGAIYTGPWAVPEYHAAGIPIRVTAIPPLADGTPWSGFMGVQGVLLNQFSADRVNAANLAKWLVRPDAQVSLARLSGRIPASVSAVELVSDDPIIAGFGEALLTAEPMPNIPEMGSVWQPMANALAVLSENPDVDVAGLFQQAVDEILGE
jgi:arabinogalactan oligomer/maltooligosaccharide transport system substrate-binding protein